MKRNISKNPIKQKREDKRVAKLEKEGRLVQGVKIPDNSIPADPSKQNHAGGYSVKYYYQDVHYVCEGCGKTGIWTAHQQKKYFEVQKGNIFNEAKWCYECHMKRIQEKFGTGASNA